MGEVVSVETLEARLAHLEGAFLQMDRRIESLERTVDARFNHFESRFTQLESRFETRFNWVIGMIVTSWISTIVTILLHR